MKKFKRLTISLDEQLIDRMKETADKMGMSLSRWIRFIAENKIRYFDNNSEKYYHKEKEKKYSFEECETIQDYRNLNAELNEKEEDYEEDFEKYLQDNFL